jgi:hypothetical protein
MGGGAYLRPRDQLKLGHLYLDRGLWNGKQIVSKEWVGEPTTVHSHFAARYSLGQQHEYGYGWHIHYLKSGAKPIGYLQPREMADSSSSSCLISTSLWGSRAAAMVSSTNGIDGSWSLCRSSLSLPLSQYIAIKQNGTLSETLVPVNYLPSFIVFGPVSGSQRAHHRHCVIRGNSVLETRNALFSTAENRSSRNPTFQVGRITVDLTLQGRAADEGAAMAMD